MVDTFRLMSQIRRDKYKDYTNEQLAQEYKKTNNQSLLAELFCKNFALYSGVVYEQKYAYIDNESKVSSLLTALYNAAVFFDVDKGYVFNTLAIKCIKQEFAAHLAKLSYQKRKNKVNDISIEAVCKMFSGEEDSDYEPEYILGVTDDQYAFVEIINTINKSNLCENEKMLCKAIINDYNITNNELAEMLNCHRHTVRAVKKGLQSKLTSVLS